MHQVEADAEVIATVVGSAPVECPFWAFEHPLVRDVMRLHADIAAGTLTLHDVPSIPARVFEAHTAFDIALKRATNERDHRRYEELQRELEAQRKDG